MGGRYNVYTASTRSVRLRRFTEGSIFKEDHWMGYRGAHARGASLLRVGHGNKKTTAAARLSASYRSRWSDRGGQYAGRKYRRQLAQFQMRQSMSRPANCYDNAFMESCFGTLKSELEMERYPNVEIARREIETYIRYYNTRRIHSSLEYVSPLDFEQRSSSTKKKREPSKS